MKAVNIVKAITDASGNVQCFRFAAGELDLEELRKLQELIGRELVAAWQAKRKAATTKPAPSKPAKAGARRQAEPIQRPFFGGDAPATLRTKRDERLRLW